VPLQKQTTVKIPATPKFQPQSREARIQAEERLRARIEAGRNAPNMEFQVLYQGYEYNPETRMASGSISFACGGRDMNNVQSEYREESVNVRLRGINRDTREKRPVLLSAGNNDELRAENANFNFPCSASIFQAPSLGPFCRPYQRVGLNG
jgi:hypothetical protein